MVKQGSAVAAIDVHGLGPFRLPFSDETCHGFVDMLAERVPEAPKEPRSACRGALSRKAAAGCAGRNALAPGSERLLSQSLGVKARLSHEVVRVRRVVTVMGGNAALL